MTLGQPFEMVLQLLGAGQQGLLGFHSKRQQSRFQQYLLNLRQVLAQTGYRLQGH